MLKKSTLLVMDNHNYTFAETLYRKLTLNTRSLFADLKFLYNLLSGTLNSPEILSLVSMDVHIRTLRRTDTFFMKPYRTDYAVDDNMTRLCKTDNNFSVLLDFFDSNSSRFESSLKRLNFSIAQL